GNSSFTITATDSNGCTGNQAYTLSVVCPTITLSPSMFTNGTVSVAYSQTVTAIGGTSPYTFSSTGTLPTGLTFTSTGVLSGTPTTGGSFTFTITATDAKGCSVNQSYLVKI